MRAVTEVPIREARALNQALIAADGVPERACLRPGAVVRGVRSALRMSQAQLARRSGVPKAHVARLEAGRLSPRVDTLERLLDAMFCGLLILPRARVRPREAVARKRAERPVPWRYRWRLWDD
jgi:transcriptional regulator with XRE-family HTH domain